MSVLKRILSRTIREQLDENQTDLERGQELTTMPSAGQGPSTPRKIIETSRLSSDDSEFSHPQIPVSPERFHEAMEALHGRSPRALTGPERPTIQDLINETRKDERVDESETLPENPSYLQESPATAYLSEIAPNDPHYSPWSPVPSESGIEEVITDNQSYRTSNVEDQDAIHRVQPLRFALLDPGSSQTSSSLGAQVDAEASGRKGRAGFYDEPSLSQTRSPTPPGLYGRREFSDLTSLGEQDWETLPAEEFQSQGQTGSSLADYSDTAGNVPIEQNGGQTRGSALARRVMRNPGIPRPNQAYVFVADLNTGEIISVPQYSLPMEGYRPLEGQRTYQHPSPLSKSHLNPFNPDIRDSSSHESAVTDSFNEMVALHGSSQGSRSVDNGANLSREREVTNPSEKKGTASSSGWISTMSESNSANNSPRQLRMGSFAKFTVLGNKGNLTGTPEGTGAREVGSSLAGASSPFTIPELDIHPNVQSLTPNRKHPHEHLVGTPKTPSTSASVSQTNQLEGHSKAHHRRSSSESNCKVIESPSSTRASALPSPGFRGHRQRNTMAGLSSSGNSSFYSEEDSKGSVYQPSLRERRGHQAREERDQISQLSATNAHQAYSDRDQTSTESHPILHEGVVYTEVPRPIIPHPVYGFDRPWDNPAQNRGRPQARSDRYQRPIARVESPHLYRIPHLPSNPMRQRQEELSKFWLPIFCVIPPFALIYGHGYADPIIRMQTNGEIETFAETSKTGARYWGYSGTPLVIAVIVLAAFIGFK